MTKLIKFSYKSLYRPSLSTSNLRPLAAFTSLTHPHAPLQAGALVAVNGSKCQTLKVVLFRRNNQINSFVVGLGGYIITQLAGVADTNAVGTKTITREVAVVVSLATPQAATIARKSDARNNHQVNILRTARLARLRFNDTIRTRRHSLRSIVEKLHLRRSVGSIPHSRQHHATSE